MQCRQDINGHKVYKFISKVIQSNMYIILDGETVLIIDTCIHDELNDFIKDKKIKEAVVILTHEHYDHIAGLNFLRSMIKCHVICSETCKDMIKDPLKNMSAFFMSIYMDQDEEMIEKVKCIVDMNYFCEAEEGFVNKKTFKFGKLDIELFETPGHSPGSICISVNHKYVFTGDSLVWQNDIITKLPGGSKELYHKTTRPFLKKLSPDTVIFPGHGDIGFIGEYSIV